MISIIVARSRNNVIGNAGKIPWHIPRDLQRFKSISFGYTVVMGRKTWESIGKPLPGRRNIVVSRTLRFFYEPNAFSVGNLNLALWYAGDQDAFVIGGAEIYRQCLPVTYRIYLTEVPGEYPGDATFDFDESEWVESSREDCGDHVFRVLERR